MIRRMPNIFLSSASDDAEISASRKCKIVLETGNFRQWQLEGFKLATTDVFSLDLIRYETPSAKYRRNAFEVSEQQMALAGYRLGAMLEQILGRQTKVEINSNNTKKSTIGQGANDLRVWIKVRSALAGVAELRDSTINVDVDNGNVILKGKVRDKKHKQIAVDTAKKIEGITEVTDLLKVSN